MLPVGPGPDRVPHYPLLPQEQLVAAARRRPRPGASRFSLVTSGRGIRPGSRAPCWRRWPPSARPCPSASAPPWGLWTGGSWRSSRPRGSSVFTTTWRPRPRFSPGFAPPTPSKSGWPPSRRPRRPGWRCAPGAFWGWGRAWPSAGSWPRPSRTLAVDAIPLNFLHPLPGTRLAPRPLLAPLEALKTVAAFRLTFPDRTLIICGGRQVTLRSLAPLLFAAGADGLMTGDYLTTRGRLPGRRPADAGGHGAGSR